MFKSIGSGKALFCVFAIVLLALNLRPPMAAIGPLLDMIHASTGLSHTEASLLTVLPVFMMGFCALLGKHLNHIFGERSGVAVGGLMIFIACLARLSLTSTMGLILTAMIAGVGIALVQVLIPAFIKRVFALQSSRVMGLYTTGIMGGAAIAAATVVGAAGYLGWPAALAVWSIPALAAVLLWWWMTSLLGKGKPLSKVTASPVPAEKSAPFHYRLRAWMLMAFFGMATGAYTLVLAWLPPFYTELGWGAGNAGFLLAGLTITEVIAGLTVSFLIGRFPDRRKPIIFVLVLLIAGFSCLLLAPLSMALIAAILLGLSIGSLFPLSLILALDHIDNPKHAGELLAFVQGGGYILACFMPLLAGYLHDQFSDFSQAWIIMIGVALIMMLMATRFSPASYRSAWHSNETPAVK